MDDLQAQRAILYKFVEEIGEEGAAEFLGQISYQLNRPSADGIPSVLQNPLSHRLGLIAQINPFDVFRLDFESH